MRKCKVKKCENEYYCKGYCRMHYARILRNGTLTRKTMINEGKICKVRNCDIKSKTKGYCGKHFSKIKKTGTLKKFYRTNKEKTCNKCMDLAVARFLCKKHYNEWWCYRGRTKTPRLYRHK